MLEESQRQLMRLTKLNINLTPAVMETQERIIETCSSDSNMKQMAPIEDDRTARITDTLTPIKRYKPNPIILFKTSAE